MLRAMDGMQGSGELDHEQEQGSVNPSQGGLHRGCTLADSDKDHLRDGLLMTLGGIWRRRNGSSAGQKPVAF